MEHGAELCTTERSNTTGYAVLGMRWTIWISLRWCCDIEKKMKFLFVVLMFDLDRLTVSSMGLIQNHILKKNAANLVAIQASQPNDTVFGHILANKRPRLSFKLKQRLKHLIS